MRLLLAVCVIAMLGGQARADTQTAQTGLIGYTEYCTNLPGGRFANNSTQRAFVMKADGTGRRELAPQLATKPNTWTQFAGWSPDGKQAIILTCWESPENAAWEEEHKTFRMIPGGWLVDSCLVDIATGKVVNLTAVERVSCYNTSVFFWPKDPTKLGFSPLIDGDSRPYSMNLDGTNKRDLSDKKGFTYGFHASPDGKRIVYHTDYQIYLADADGANTTKVETGNSFNFAPTWSPDGQWVLFVSGKHLDCHPTIVKRDGTGVKKIADRGGYTGTMQYLDVADFHGGSSDMPIWSIDGKWVYYTAKVGEAIELMRASLKGKTEQLTHSPAGVSHYHPTPSPDGRWLLFGVIRDGVRQLCVSLTDGSESRQITSLTKGHAAMWASWQP